MAMIESNKPINKLRKISKNEAFSESNITTKRPGNGISPMKWEKAKPASKKEDGRTDGTLPMSIGRPSSVKCGKFGAPAVGRWTQPQRMRKTYRELRPIVAPKPPPRT